MRLRTHECVRVLRVCVVHTIRFGEIVSSSKSVFFFVFCIEYNSPNICTYSSLWWQP